MPQPDLWVHHLTINGCARCGGDHQHLRFAPLLNAPPESSHFAACPETGQPVLMRLVRRRPPVGRLAAALREFWRELGR